MKDSFSLIGILNQECVILPLFIKSVAISKEAIVIAISLYNLIYTSKVL